MTKRRNAPTTPARQTVDLPFKVDRVNELRIQRAAGDEVDVVRVEGHASVFDYEYEVWGGPPWGWIESIDRGAFDETLAEDPDVVFLRNHTGMPLARTKSGTLELVTDDVGLAVRAELDPANPEVQALVSALERGDVDEMSFAFRVTEQTWKAHDDWEDDEMSLRIITGINLNRGDVSAVTFGASDGTDIDMVGSIERLSERELVEARAAIERRISETSKHETPGGMPGGVERGGMPDSQLLETLLPSNPHLQEFLRDESRADQAPVGATG